MRSLLIRILKNGLPTAILLAVFGYVLAEGAAVWFDAQPTYRPAAEPDTVAASPAPAPDLARQLRSRIPFTLAAWGFGLVVVFEVVLHIWRGGKAPQPPTPRPSVDVETEKLLNDLLAKAEAERAAACNPSPPADNTGVPH